MGEFWQGLGTRAGSVWFATLLNNPDHGLYVVNEQVKHCATIHWMHTLRQQVDDLFDPGSRTFRRYFEFAEHKSAEGIFCDFNSFAPCFMPEVDKRLKIDRMIGLVRNGIPQLYSLTNSYIWSRVTEDHWLVDRFLRKMWEFGGKKGGKSFSQRTFWEKRCVQWTCMVNQYDVLRDRGFALDVHKLEDLTTNTGYLRNVLQTYDPRRVCSEEYLLGWQKNDMNRRVRGSRKPLAIWRRWSQEQQEGFTEMCGDGMRRYGYDIPRVGE